MLHTDRQTHMKQPGFSATIWYTDGDREAIAWVGDLEVGNKIIITGS